MARSSTDLLGYEEKEAKAPRNPNPPMVEEWVKNICDCGAGGRAMVYHYDVVRCDCGHRYQALRPKRNGPLKLFPFPGHYWEKIKLPE